MAKIKLTKTELKSQQDSLKQYNRFLPTLQLKKQQLQMEIRNSIEQLEENRREQKRYTEKLRSFIAVFSDKLFVESLQGIVVLKAVESSYANIAGVNVPVFEKAIFDNKKYDYFTTPWVFDDAVASLEGLVALREAGKIIEEQHRLLNIELRTTTQRVNLFEKVKIPECKENIRKISIQLSDLSTAAVARSKIAKKKTMEASA